MSNHPHLREGRKGVGEGGRDVYRDKGREGGREGRLASGRARRMKLFLHGR